MKQFFFCVVILSFSSVFGQISSGKKEPVVVKEVEIDTIPRRIPSDGLNEFTIYIGAGRNYTSRLLKPNSEPFGKELGERANETGIKIWTYQFGVRNRLNQFLSYDAALALDKYGETYLFESELNDSSYSYTNTYSFISVPIQLFATYGKDFRWFIGGGIQPQIIAGYRQETVIQNALGTKTETTLKTTEGLNGTTFSAIFSAGFQWRWNQRGSVYFTPSYVFGLTNTYAKQEAYQYFIRGFNLKFGVAFHIPESKN